MKIKPRSELDMGEPTEESIWDLFTLTNLTAFVFGAGTIICYIFSYLNISNFIGNKLSWATLREPVTAIWWKTILGSFLLFITAMLYFFNDTAKAMYFVIGLSCVTLCMSYTALSISAISSVSS
jgi:hypothetical protein